VPYGTKKIIKKKVKKISIGSNKLQPINPNNYCTSLVVRGSNLVSNIGIRFNNSDLKPLYLTSFYNTIFSWYTYW
jgi:hypothetical protein